MHRLRDLDPRYYQITILAILLTYGLGWLSFDISVGLCALMIATALATQFACTKIFRLPKFDPKSALISGLSLALLLRTDVPALAILGAVIAVASKFVIRWKGKHLFNPTNGAIVALMLFTGKVWVSPGQWGNVAFFGFLMMCLGGLVVNRAARSDVTYAFIITYLSLVFWRSWHLGEPMTIPYHRLQSGALLLFTFFMISDPKTTPDSRMGRVIFAELCAAGAYFIQFKLFRTNGALWSLALFSLAVPFLDVLIPGRRYQWANPQGKKPESVSPPAPASEPAPVLARAS